MTKEGQLKKETTQNKESCRTDEEDVMDTIVEHILTINNEEG